MMILSATDQPTLLQWAALRCAGPDFQFSQNAEALGVLDEETGRVIAVMVVDGAFYDAALVHFASDGSKIWCSHRILAGLFGYLFVYKRLARVIGMTPADNVAALKMVMMMGFQIEGRMRSTISGEADIVSMMFAEECRWIKQELEHSDGQEISTPT
jgi:hypothetical protein